MLDLMLEELDQVRGDGLRAFVFGGVVRGLVGIVGLDDGHNLLRVDGDVGCSDAVVGTGDEVGLAEGGEVGAGDIVQTLEGGHGGVDLDDDLLGHLDQLGRSTDGSTGDDATVLGDGSSLNDSHVDSGLGLVQSVPTLGNC